MNNMEKLRALAMLGLLVLPMFSILTTPVSAEYIRPEKGNRYHWHYGTTYNGYVRVQPFISLIQAYAEANTLEVAEQVFAAADKLSASLDELNAVISEQWENLDRNEQEALINWYTDLGNVIETIVNEANTIFATENSIIKAEFQLWYTKEVGPGEVISINYEVIKPKG